MADVELEIKWRSLTIVLLQVIVVMICFVCFVYSKISKEECSSGTD